LQISNCKLFVMLFITIIIILFSLVVLTALHELGHFLLAKKFGVKVEEFGIGYPPKIFGKKFGQTLYSLNLLPFGAFVRILGEEEASNSRDSFTQKPIWQRALILLAGVVSFWLVAFLILIFIIGFGGVPTAVPDDFFQTGVKPFVQIIQVSPGSPAEEAGLKPGDTINKLKVKSEKLKVKKVEEEVSITKAREVQDFVAEHKGEEVIISLQRGEDILGLSLIPRINPPQGEGAMGVALARVAYLKYPWYEAPFQSAKLTWQQTKAMPLVLVKAIKDKITGNKAAMSLQLVGPIGIGQIMGQAMHQGWSNYFMLIAMISIWMALFNLLPIPALDGGRLLFLGIELVRRKPLNHKLEQKIIGAFFFLLVVLMVIVSVRDIVKLF